MIDEALTELAATQGGLFRRADALAVGVHPSQLRGWVGERRCRPVIRGVYSTTPMTPYDRDGQLLEKTRAMLLSNPGVAAAGRSALVLHGIDTYGVSYARAQGVWLNACATRSTESVIIRRPLVPPPVVEVDTWLTVPASWALVDVARDAGVVAGVVSADCALRQGQATAVEVGGVIDAHPRSHRIQRAARMLQLVDARSESPGESRTRLILLGAGFALEPQFRVIADGEVIARADFRVAGTPVLVEFDGMSKYKGEHGVKALMGEKVREDALRRLGWRFVRVIWPELDRPRMLADRVRAAVAELAA